MPSATVNVTVGPHGQMPELNNWQARIQMACKLLKITPNFSFAMVRCSAEADLVCEQRNAAFVRMALGERKVDVGESK